MTEPGNNTRTSGAFRSRLDFARHVETAMTPSRKQPSAAFCATVVVFVLLVATVYPIAYVLLMQPIWVVPHFDSGNWQRDPIYRVSASNNEMATRIFTLAHRIDRRVRPDFWSEKKPYLGGKHP
jgi:hypothetical protein